MSHFLLGLSGGLFGFDSALHRNQPKPLLRGVQPTALAIDPSVPTRIYCATYNRGLWRSEDSGDTWYAIGTPQNYYGPTTNGAIGTDATTFVSVDPTPTKTGRHTVWVGTELSRLYRSDDYGETFELVTSFDQLKSRSGWSFPPRPGTHHVQWIAHGPNNALYVCIEAGAILRSFDDGTTFEDRRAGSPLDTHTLCIHPAAPDRLYAATGDGLIQSGHAWAESRDGGTTWRYASRGLEAMPYLYGLAVNPGDPDDIRIAASPDALTAHFHGQSSIYRSAGEIWIENAEGFPKAHSLTPVLASDSNCAGCWFALSNLGLFRQEPGEQAWQLVTGVPEWRHMHPACFAQTEY